MTNYFGKKIVVIGLGLTGLSCINFFITRGIMPRIMDTRISPPGLKNLPKEIEYYIGGLNDNWLLAADLIVVSPGVSLTHPSLILAANSGIEIINDIELFCREVKKPIIAITGTNGKSTVTTLVGEIAKAAGINVGIGGNIGIPALVLLDNICELYVLELSSFQLERTSNLKTIASTILNITEDHLDRYMFDLQKYQTVKLSIYKNAKTCIFNANDKLTIPYNVDNSRCVSFGIDKGDYSISKQKNKTWLLANGEKVLNIKNMRISNQHNYINSLAALALADSAGLPREISLKVLSTFPGLTHRFQLVLENNGVKWINDSKSTNIGSTKAALNGLQLDGILYLLLGGDGKSANFSSLSPYLTNIKIRPYCFGSDASAIVALCPPGVAQQTETMEQAIRQIAPQLKPGDIVLLSPACSSLDQFKNFEHRGAIFTDLAKELG